MSSISCAAGTAASLLSGFATLPSGRDRLLRVLEVTGGLLAADEAPREVAVKAA